MAGITHYDQFTKPALRGLVDAMENERKQEEQSLNAVESLVSEENVYSHEFAYDVIKKSNQIAAMIGVGAEPPVRDKDAVARRMGEMAKFGLKDIVTEEELLKLHQPRNNAEQSALIDKLTVKGADLVKNLQDRIKISKVQVLTQGKINYDDNNVKVSIDFTEDMPDSHKVVLTGDNTWANPEHDVIGDLIAWDQQYQDTNGKQADVILMSRETQALLLKNTVIVTEAAGINNSGRGRVSVDDLNSVLGGYGLPGIRVVNKTKANVKNTYTGEVETIELFPENRVIFVSSGVGKFLLGPTVENTFQPGIVLQAYDKFEPIESILRAVAMGFPIIENPNLLLFADVVEG